MATKNPRGGAPKMMNGPMLAPKSIGHYEAHARGIHRADGHLPGAPHSAGVKVATGAHVPSKSRSANFPHPPMGKGKGAGGY